MGGGQAYRAGACNCSAGMAHKRRRVTLPDHHSDAKQLVVGKPAHAVRDTKQTLRNVYSHFAFQRAVRQGERLPKWSQGKNINIYWYSNTQAVGWKCTPHTGNHTT